MIGVVTAEADPQGSIVELAIAGDEFAFARIVAAHHDDMTLPSRRQGPTVVAVQASKGPGGGPRAF